ncbi:MAG: hypothetical protein WA840_17585 [Caulobacteraceae bacterium]
MDSHDDAGDRSRFKRSPTQTFDSKPDGYAKYFQEKFYSILSRKDSETFEIAIPRADGGP